MFITTEIFFFKKEHLVDQQLIENDSWYCGVKKNASEKMKCATEGLANLNNNFKLFVNLRQNISFHKSHFQKHTSISHFARNLDTFHITFYHTYCLHFFICPQIYF